ncbi:hypothetical protein AW40_04295 [Kosakonia radicincitans UMEnt01/12]|nr:hypothetical protein AW40_04295 [Kosakonia radicincitans UMEnt01/12]
MLRYCLFLRGAPHRLKAKISHCTKLVPLMFPAGATLLHISGFHSCLICISKWHARNDWMAAKMGPLGSVAGWRLCLIRPTVCELSAG